MTKREKRKQVRKGGGKKAKNKGIKSIVNKISILLMIISIPFLIDIWISAFTDNKDFVSLYSIGFVASALGLFSLSFILRTITMKD